MLAGNPVCDEVGEEEKHELNGEFGYREGGGDGDEKETALVGSRGADKVPPCVQAAGR